MREDRQKAEEGFGKKHGDMPNARIAFFLPSLAGGGAERSVLELARGFAKHGFALVTRTGGAYWKSVSQDVRLVNFGSWMTLTCLPKLVRYVRREKLDVLLASVEPAQAAALMGKMFFPKGTRLIIRQVNALMAAHAFGTFKQRMCKRIVRRLAPRADAIIAVSSGVAYEFRRTIPKAAPMVQAIPEPVITSDLLKTAEFSVRHPWFDDPNIPVIATAGRLVPQKDHLTLLRAIAEVASLRPVRLLILGEGPMRDKLTMTARKLDITQAVDFVGFQDNPFAWMAKARVLVLSSRHEGLSWVLIEAMACGTPVVSTDCPYGPREILEGDRLGPLVPVGDHSALAQGILTALDTPVSSALLRASVQRYFSTTSIEQYVRLVTSVISGSRCPT